MSLSLTVLGVYFHIVRDFDVKSAQSSFPLSNASSLFGSTALATQVSPLSETGKNSLYCTQKITSNN